MKSKRLDFVLVGVSLACGLASASSLQARTVQRPSLDDTSPQGHLMAFADSLKYPPESQPIDDSYWDLLHPWSVDTEPALMLTKEAVNRFLSLQLSGVSQ